MACGKPVVCTHLKNGVNVVNIEGETGLAAPPGDSVALAGVLQRLAGDEALRARLGRAGLQRAHGVYSLEAMTASHLQLYERLLST